MRTAYKVIAQLAAALVGLQAAWIAYGVFEMARLLDDGRSVTKDNFSSIGFEMHPIFGTLVIPLLLLALVVISYFTKVPGSSKHSWGIIGLYVIQFVLAMLGFLVHPIFGLLHGINAFLLFLALIAGVRLMYSTQTGAAT